MAVKTAEEYYQSLKDLHPVTYILGEKVADPYEHPLIKHQLAGVAETYALAQEPEGEKYLVSKASLVLE